MTKRKTPVIESVLYSYTGTDDDFNRFLKAVVHDFISILSPLHEFLNGMLLVP